MAAKRSFQPAKHAAVGPQPDGKIRQSQVITTYGPGATIDLLNDAVLVQGLDLWRFDRAKEIAEPRLRDAIAERMRAQNRNLREERAFLFPPTGNDSQPNSGVGIPVLEFPRYFICQNPRCRAVIGARGLQKRKERYVHDCVRNALWDCVPVRFVMACKRGHLEDFPWVSFAHSGGKYPRCAAPQISLQEGATGDVSEVVAHCVCGAHRKLSEAFNWQTNPRCAGERPWLGRESSEPCEERLRLLVRTASNSYFSQVESALSIPNTATATLDLVRKHWTILQAASPATLPSFRSIPDIEIAFRGVPDGEILRNVQAVKEGKPVEREPIRTAEFRTLTEAPPEVAGDMPQLKDEFFARILTERGALTPAISRVVLAHKLRTVKVQVGFTRIEGATPSLQGEYDLDVKSAPLGLQTDWLPAFEVRGEGLFIQLDEKRVQSWERSPAVQLRAAMLEKAYERWAEMQTSALPFPGARFYMLHSLSHLLMTALSLSCGYAASSLQERIYCAPAEDTVPMAAILLSTGTPGAEGTLGGLVQEGRRLHEHLRTAYEIGTLCSNDPVCASHKPHADPTERFLEGAACHGCLYVAECSCERFNRYLDRTLVVPTLGHEGVAFFQEPP